MPNAETPHRGPEEMPVALVTGITGQDGGYLAELLLEKGYVVHGLSRMAESLDRIRFQDVADIGNRLHLHNCDLRDGDAVFRLIEEIRPAEIYNLAAQTHVQASYEDPDITADVNAAGADRLLRVLEKIYPSRDVRFFQASTSEMFGDAKGVLLNEETPLRPLSPYAISKLQAFEATVKFRETLGFFASNGILFNHESPHRGLSFVTRKISSAVAARHLGDRQPLRLGNLDVRRDWGHARDYAEAMWLILRHDFPGDYVVATGENHSVREFVEIAFAETGREIEWQGTGMDERGLDMQTREVLVEIDPAFFRHVDVVATLGDASKARAELGWRPRVSFRALVGEMVAGDIRRLSGLARSGTSAGPD
ncbi:MAG: GDP-mannose 4,6-dehydratase [Parvibaculum sp.]|uniref:GDP-mannose 4,6-dehydratase n=1 Tax=Parvibaculum sp. TaxID=2024848 RepID=UPI00326415CD